MSERDEGSPPLAEGLPEGHEPPPPGTRTMAIVRWALVGAMALAAGGAWVHHASEGSAHERAEARWRCPMHPAVVQERPGDCPICGMDLVRADALPAPAPAAAATPATQGRYWCPMHPEVASDDPEATCARCGGMKLVPREPAKPAATIPGLGGVQLSAERTQLMGLRTARAARQRLAPDLRTVGFVSADERRVAIVNARYGGWVQRLEAVQSGQPVRKGDVLLAMYSGELVQAQQAYLNAIRWKQNLQEKTPGELPATAKALDRDSLWRLHLYGMADVDIAALAKRGEPANDVPVRSPITGHVARKAVLPGQYVAPGSELYQIADLSSVWVLADVYEQDMGRVASGQKASLAVAAYPGKRFEGRVEFIYPAVNPETRTLQARMQFSNPGLKLRPGMYGEVRIALGASEAVTVPAEAVVDTGEERYVFVAREGGRFEPRVVEVGARAGDRVEILAGVVEGEEVVTTASFYLDAESRLRAALEGHAATGLAGGTGR